jgi:hypothetical protein
VKVLDVDVISIAPGPKPDYLTAAYKLTASVDGNTGTAELGSYLVKTKDGLKIDWAASNGYNPISFTSLAAGNTSPLTLRVIAEQSTFFKYQYAKAEGTHHSIELEQRVGERTEKLHGYVAKDSTVGKRLFDIMNDGQKHKLVITVQRSGVEPSVVDISELVSDSWVLSPEETAAMHQKSAQAKAKDAEARAKDAETKAKAEEQAAKKKAEADANAKKERSEVAAASKLKAAKLLQSEGKTADARDYCEEIIKKYPDTKAAEEAKTLLEKLGKK